jgi:tRNA (mo5U34)-methyltransferase
MAALTEEVRGLRWYHTIELPGGVVTPGLFDHRRVVRKLPIPPSLAGMRCLDVGTADGFWAFEMERRGAAEVLAIDLIDPSFRDVTVGAAARTPLPEGEVARAARTFALARDALGSRVAWRNLSVYDLHPDEVGTFDFVFMGSLIVHLRDPVLALQAVRSVTRGTLLSYDAVSPLLTLLHPRMPAARLRGLARAEWWLPNVACLRQMIRAAGFRIERAGGISFVRRRRARPRIRTALRHPLMHAMLVTLGIPQSWVLARSQDGSQGERN